VNKTTHPGVHVTRGIGLHCDHGIDSTRPRLFTATIAESLNLAPRPTAWCCHLANDPRTTVRSVWKFVDVINQQTWLESDKRRRRRRRSDYSSLASPRWRAWPS